MNFNFCFKTILFQSLILIICFNAVAQEPQSDPIKEHIYNIPYVFEGIVDSVEFYPGDSLGNRVPLKIKPLSQAELDGHVEMEHDYLLPNGTTAYAYALATIKLCKIYKGKDFQKQESVQILIPLKNYIPTTSSKYFGSVGISRVRSSHSKLTFVPPGKGEHRIFFCSSNEIGVLQHYEVENNWIGVAFHQWYRTKGNVYAFAPNRFIYSQEELDDYLKTLPTLKKNPKNLCEASSEKKNAGGEAQESSINESNPIPYSEHLRNYQNWLNAILPALNNPPLKSVTSSPIHYSFELKNERIIGTFTDKFLEFDVELSSNNPVYFDNCLLRIEYNTSAFGTNLVANNRVQIVRSSDFNTTTYTNPQTDCIDQASNTLGIPLGISTSTSSIQRTAIGPTPKIVLTLRLKISNCEQNANVTFKDIDFTPIFSFYTLSATTPSVESVACETTNYTGNITDKPCYPQIISFTDGIPAGVNQLITITGKYFGDSYTDSSTIIFKNADRGDVYPPEWGPHKGGLQNYDIRSWSHNEIKIKLPSIIDSVRNPSTGKNLYPTPGSGKFKVINRYDKATESTTPIFIPYAVAHVIENPIENPTSYSTYRKARISPIGVENGGYTLHLHPNVSSTYPRAKAVIQKALRDWSCATGINWTLGADTSINLNREDDVSVVQLTSTFDDNTIIMETQLKDYMWCRLTGLPATHKLEAFDIAIRHPLATGRNWQFDTTGNIDTYNNDFYQLFLHELGHAHLLEHSNNTDLMEWATASGATEAQRKNLNTSPNTVNGGTEVILRRVIDEGCPANPHQPLVIRPCVTLDIFESNASLWAMVYPNPISDNETLHLKFNLNTPQDINLTLRSLTGQELYNRNFQAISEQEEQVSLKNWASGIYFITLSHGSQQHTFKIVKP